MQFIDDYASFDEDIISMIPSNSSMELLVNAFKID